jgi:hypothetical protein
MTDETSETFLRQVTRVEYIDITGRVLVRYLDAPGVVLSMQDDDRTLKVFTLEKFGTFEDPAAALQAVIDGVERVAILDEMAAWVPDEEYRAEADEWMNAPMGRPSGDASSEPRPPAQ